VERNKKRKQMAKGNSEGMCLERGRKNKKKEKRIAVGDVRGREWSK